MEILLDGEGHLASGAEAATQGLDLRSLYKQLVAARTLDLKLSRMGLPMWAPAAGEEAPLVLAGILAGDEDWIYAGGRDAAATLARGVSADQILRQALGAAGAEVPLNAAPGSFGAPSRNVAPSTEGLGLHLALAAGQAHGQKLARQGDVTFALFGEGLSTSGAFHEAISLAVTADLPLIFVCRSQLWPDQAPAEAGLLGDDVASRVRALDMVATRVDGADVVGTYRALANATERAREGRGPSLIEVVVSPLHHDPPAERDPVERLRRHLDRTGQWTQTFQDVIEAEFGNGFDRALADLRAESENA